MHQALITLYRLRVRGTLRQVVCSFGTARGAAMAIFSLAVFACMICPGVITALLSTWNRRPTVELWAHEILSFALLGFCLASLTTAAGETVIYFSPSEIDFLFPAPFTRRELLVYKILAGGTARVFIALILATSLMFYLHWWLASFIGFLLVSFFIHALSLCWHLIAQIASEHVYTRGRRAILALAGTLLVMGGIQVFAQTSFTGSWRDQLHQIHSSWGGTILLAPVEIYAHVITSPRLYPDLISWALLGLGIDVGLYMAALALDANYLEASVKISQRVQQRVQRARQGGAFVASDGQLARTMRTRWLPRFPWLGGAGPIARRQLLILVRSGGGILKVAFILTVAVGVPMAFVTRDVKQMSHHFPLLAIGALAYVSLIASSQAPFGFRGDLEHLPWLKSLPIRPLAVALGEVVPVVVLLACGQCLLLLVLAVVFPSRWHYLGVATGFTIPFNLTLFGVENLVFLLYPTHLHGSGGSGGLMQMGRMFLTLFIKSMSLTLCAAFVVAIGLLVFWLTRNWTLTVMVSWLAFLLPSVALFLPLARAFERFDVSNNVWE